MGNFNSDPSGTNYTASVLNALFQTHFVGDVVYTSVPLSYREPDPAALAGVPDPAIMLADGHDPDVRLRVTHAVVHWPEGHPHSDLRQKVETVLSAFQANEKQASGSTEGAQAIGRLVLGAHIDKSALTPAETNLGNMRHHFNSLHGGQGDQKMAALCSRVGAPLGVVLVGKVVQSRAIADGSTVASLWHPIYARPEWVLGQMQQALITAGAIQS